MAASSSSSGAARIYSVWLYAADGKTRIALVDLPWPLPAIVVYQGNYYAYSPFVSSKYVQESPYVATADLGAPPLSVLAFPEY
jgi:hypothetical protein